MKKTLFFSNFGIKLNLFERLKNDKLVQLAIKKVDILK